jgi:hypothetical protein
MKPTLIMLGLVRKELLLKINAQSIKKMEMNVLLAEKD